MPLEMLGRTRFPPIGEPPYVVTLAPYGFFWFRSRNRRSGAASNRRPFRNSRPWWCRSADLDVVAHTRGVLERDVLPEYLARPLVSEALAQHITKGHLSGPVLRYRRQPPWLAFFEVTTELGEIVPLRAADADPMGSLRPRAYDPARFAAVRHGPREGTLLDAPPTRYSSSFCCAICANPSASITENGLRLEFRPTARLRR